MTEERRKAERVSLNLTAKWSGFSGKHEARVEDVSIGGCFVNTPGRVDVGEIVGVEIKLPSGEWLPVRGKVVSYQEGIGFGLLFSFLSPKQEQALRKLLA